MIAVQENGERVCSMSPHYGLPFSNNQSPDGISVSVDPVTHAVSGSHLSCTKARRGKFDPLSEGWLRRMGVCTTHHGVVRDSVPPGWNRLEVSDAVPPIFPSNAENNHTRPYQTSSTVSRSQPPVGSGVTSLRDRSSITSKWSSSYSRSSGALPSKRKYPCSLRWSSARTCS